jgi:hypothetical protein
MIKETLKIFKSKSKPFFFKDYSIISMIIRSLIRKKKNIIRYVRILYSKENDSDLSQYLINFSVYILFVVIF